MGGQGLLSSVKALPRPDEFLVLRFSNAVTTASAIGPFRLYRVAYVIPLGSAGGLPLANYVQFWNNATGAGTPFLAVQNSAVAADGILDGIKVDALYGACTAAPAGDFDVVFYITRR